MVRIWQRRERSAGHRAHLSRCDRPPPGWGELLGMGREHPLSRGRKSHDGVTRLEVGEDVWAITRFNQDALLLTSKLAEIHARVAPNIESLPQLGISRQGPRRWRPFPSEGPSMQA